LLQPPWVQPCQGKNTSEGSDLGITSMIETRGAKVCGTIAEWP